MIRILSSEWLRTKRTPIRWLTFCVPVLFSLCITAYLAARAGSTQNLAFEVFFTAWAAIVIPVGAGVMAGFIVQEEELAGSFNGFLSVNLSRWKLYLGKYLLLVFCLAVSTLLATVVLCAGMQIFLPGGVNVRLFLEAAVLLVVGTLPLLALHLWAAFVWGMGASIGIGMGGLLVAALIGTTSLGNAVWQFVPWAWPAKLAAYPSVFLLQETPALVSASTHALTTGLFASAIGLVLALGGGILWFYRWEGRQNHE